MPLATRRLTRPSGRRGFTLPEILIVIVLISLLSLVAIPRFASANGKRHMESARMRVAAALATARAAAIQKSYPVVFQIDQNRVTVKRDTTNATNIISPVPLDTLYNVKASGYTNPLVIKFSARGFANYGSKLVIKLKRSGVADDSVVVMPTGMVTR